MNRVEGADKVTGRARYAYEYRTEGPPAYACPVFVRLSSALDSTETFKQKKQDLIRAGFDPRTIADPLFFRDPKSGAFLPFDADQYAKVEQGIIRL